MERGAPHPAGDLRYFVLPAILLILRAAIFLVLLVTCLWPCCSLPAPDEAVQTISVRGP